MYTRHNHHAIATRVSALLSSTESAKRARFWHARGRERASVQDRPPAPPKFSSRFRRVDRCAVSQDQYGQLGSIRSLAWRRTPRLLSSSIRQTQPVQDHSQACCCERTAVINIERESATIKGSIFQRCIRGERPREQKKKVKKVKKGGEQKDLYGAVNQKHAEGSVN